MAYNLVFTTMWSQTYRGCFDYIANVLQNGQALKNVIQDIESTLEILKHSAGSFALCEDEDLARAGLRKIHLKHHRYKIFYTIDGRNVYVRALLNDLQDFEHTLK